MRNYIQMNRITYLLSTLACIMFLAACNMDLEPTDGITEENLSDVPDALKYATNGVYSLMKDQLAYKGTYDYRSTYSRNLHMMLEYAGDNVTLSGTTTDPLYYCAIREHFPAMENSTYVWYVGYKIVSNANANIESVEEGESDENDMLLGENYFLRGMAFFDLLRVFAKPYTLGTDNPGIILRLKTTDPDAMARSTVGESYEQVAADLKKAAELMSVDDSRGIAYASKEAAWALLSRLYLYMDDYYNAITYATQVIESGQFSLVSKDNYINSFWNTPDSEESIFIVKHTVQDDLGTGSIGSMYLTDEIGWGEVYESEPLRELLEEHPEDVRNDFIVPAYASDGVTISERNGIPMYYITKFSYQDDVVTLSSPHVVRLAEMYLNRAEAYAKQGEDDAALADANVIRARAGLADEDLYTTSDLQGTSTVLEAVLQERRLELAYEAHRPIDVYRNKLSMDRTFPGVQPEEIVPYDDINNIYYIPQDEMLTNELVEQNQ